MDKQTVYSRLRQHFNGPFENPLILLVYSKKIALNLFKVAGVDMTGWRVNGLRDLLVQDERNFRPGRPPPPGPGRGNNTSPYPKQEHDSKSNVRIKGEHGVKQEFSGSSRGGPSSSSSYDRKPNIKRPRSPSPDKRNVKRPPSRSPMKDEGNSSRPAAGPQRNHTVHIIDVKELFRVVSNIYAPLEYTREALGVELHRSGWCAGNMCL